MRRTYLAMIGVLAAFLVPATAQAANVAVLGNNQTDEVLVAAGHTVTLVTDAQVATAGFLDGFDVFVFTRGGGSFNATLSAGAAAEVRAFTRRAVLLNGDFADDIGGDQEIRDLFVSSVLWAGEEGGGYIGELEGATAGLSANGDGQPALNLIAGTAGTSQFTGNESTITITPAGTGHPVLQNVALPHTADNIEFAAPVSGAAEQTVLARYTGNDNPAILAAELTNVAVLGNNSTDEQLNAAAGIVATLVTDAQVATAGFLDDFDVFLFTRGGGSFNATLSAGAAAQVRAFTRRAVLLNGDFADDISGDQEIRDLYVSSVLWAGEQGGGYIGELEGATAGLSANGDGQPALNLIAGTAGTSQFTGNESTITITPAGTGHPVLDGVALPHTADNIEFAAPITGAPAPKVLARYAANDNPAILATEVTQVAVLGNNSTDEQLNAAAGIVATLVTDAQVATAGFLAAFDVFVFTRGGGSFNATLSAGAAAEVRAFTRRAVLLNGDFADDIGGDQEIRDLFVSSVLWAGEEGGGYIGELEGATAGLSANGDGQPALNLIAGTAGTSQFTGNESTITITPAGTGHPVLQNVALPHTADNIEFAAPVSGAAEQTVLARYTGNDNPAILAAELTNVAVLGNNSTDEQLNAAAGIVATLVTDAQVATAGFLDDFDVFLFTRGGGSFNATLSAGAAAQVRAFTRRAVLLNGDFADDISGDQEIRDLYVSSVLWAGEQGGGYIGELEGATAGLSANGDGQPALNLIAGTAGTSQFTGNESTITITPAGTGHPVLDGVALPHTADNIEFAAPITGAAPATVLARYANGNPAILATAGANRPPVATDDAVTTAEDTAVSIVLAGTDPDGDPLTITVTTPPAHGSFAGGVYTPTPNYHGPDSIEFTVSDGNGGSDTGTISITVTPVNDLPVCSPQSFVVPANGQHSGTLVCTDADDATLSYEVVSGPTHGVLVLAAGGGFTYTPDPGYFGPDVFTFRAVDVAGGSGSATVTITVTAPPDPNAPTCVATATGRDAAGNPYVEYTLRDSAPGLASVEVLQSTNATTPAPVFTAGTTDPVVVRATRTDDLGATVVLRATDVVGNATTCQLTFVAIGQPGPFPHDEKLSDVPRAQHFVSFQNGTDPGLRRIIVKVNGVIFKHGQLAPGERGTFDIASAMTNGANRVAIDIEGKKHGTAVVILHDGSASLLG